MKIKREHILTFNRKCTIWITSSKNMKKAKPQRQTGGRKDRGRDE